MTREELLLCFALLFVGIFLAWRALRALCTFLAIFSLIISGVLLLRQLSLLPASVDRYIELVWSPEWLHQLRDWAAVGQFLPRRPPR